MHVSHRWTGAVVALVVLNGAAFAEVTVSTATNPTASLGAEFASLMNTEHATMQNVPSEDLSALAIGPKPVAKAEVVAEADVVAEVAAAPAAIDYTYQWLISQNAPQGGDEWDCLRQALYFEARGETLKGQYAVAEVILNRVDSPAYPSTICGVVQQGGNGACQFSYICDGASDAMNEAGAVDRASRIARAMLDGAPRALTNGATHFHTLAVAPGWSRQFVQTASIGAHLFYRQP